MNFPFFKGNEEVTTTPEQPINIPASQHAERIQPENYLASSDLKNAVNVALLLGKPLLLTGEPGTGKTLLAYRIAWELGFGEPLKFETKSTSLSKDLFYYYNSLARFHEAQFGKQNPSASPTQHKDKVSGVDYITYNALGTAIIRTKEQEAYASLFPADFIHEGKQRSIVLIDEIDKAPRDFPNDILNELEHMYFRVPELGNKKIEADMNLAPVVVITSNSEKSLPDAFLRRCIFHHIEFPDKSHLEKIVFTSLRRLEKEDQQYHFEAKQQLNRHAIDLFLELRSPQNRLKKPPSISELLLWIETIARTFAEIENPLLESDETYLSNIALNILIKQQSDQDMAKRIIGEWMKRHRKRGQ